MSIISPKSILLTALIIAVASCDIPDSTPVLPSDPPAENPSEKPSEKPDEKPEEKPVATRDNTYVIDGTEYTFGSAAVTNFGEYLCIAASPSENVEGFDAILEQDEYLYVAISPLLNGKEFDLMTEKVLFTVISTISGASIESLAPDTLTGIAEGKCIFAYEDGLASVDILMKLDSGIELSAKMSAEEPALIVNENIFAINGDTKPVRTAFHESADGLTTIYLTPAGISYFEELEITTYYAYIILEDSQCNGRTLNIKDIECAGYGDNLREIYISSENTETTGTVNVLRDPEDPSHYILAADLDFEGNTLELQYDGQAISTMLKEEKESSVTYEGNKQKIQEVSLDKTPNPEFTYTAIISTEDGTEIRITFPLAYLDGNAHGFSQSPYLTITYGETTFSKATGYSGTVTIGTEDDTITIEATNYKNFEIFYQGSFKTIE